MDKLMTTHFRWRLDSTCFSAVCLALTIALTSCDTTSKITNFDGSRKPWTSSNTNATALTTGYLSDQDWTSATGTWGPVSENLAYGEGDPADRKKITLSGTQYEKGLGTHADSSITYKLDPNCSRFKASIGLDDQVRWQTEHGNVLFQIFGNNTKLFDSSSRNRNSPTKNVDLDVSGQSSLTLVVDQNWNSTEADQSDWYDQADWANARVECAGSITPPAGSKNVVTYGARGDGVTDDSAAIQAAIDDASSGGVVFLPAPAAFYRISGTIQITKPLTLLGADSLIKNPAAACPTYIEIAANNVQIRGLHLTGPQQSCGYAIHVGGAGGPFGNIKIEDNQLENFYNGITMLEVDGFRVAGNALSDMDYYGILGSAVKNGVIDKNTVRGVWGNNSGGNAYGIVLSRNATIPTNPRSTDVIVSNNNVEDVPVWECYDTHGGQRIQFINNTCKNAKLGINVAFSGKGQDDPNALAPLECEVRGNTVEKNATEPYRDAIVFAGTYTQTATGSITDNTVIGFGPTGIYLVNANVTQLNNTRK